MLSSSICNLISFLIDKMFDERDEEYDATRDIQREEGKSRIKLDTQDRNKVFMEMETHPNPLQTDTNNIVKYTMGVLQTNTSTFIRPNILVKKRHPNSEKNLPGGLHTPLQKKCYFGVYEKDCSAGRHCCSV